MKPTTWTPAALLLLTASAIAAEPVDWPGGARTAVSLSYDDALHSQLDHAVPALNEYGFKATFYVTVGAEAMRERLGEWRALARQGHQLGNHTIYHPCSGSRPDRAWVEPHNDLDRQSVAQIRREIAVANTFLEALDGSTRRTYAATCYERLAGGEDYWPAIEDLFAGVRDLDHGMDAGSKIVWGPSDAATTGEALIRFVEGNAGDGRLIALVFHGVGGDYLSVTAEAHRELLGYLAAHRDDYWVDTYLNIVDHVRAQHAAASSHSIALD